MSPKQMEIAQAVDKNKEAYDADMAEAKNRFRQNAAPDLKAGKFPQAANDQYAKDTADIWRKWGKKAGDAAIQ